MSYFYTDEDNRKEWAKHWQCNTEVQDLEDKPWRNGELRSLEEGLTRLKEEHFEKAATSYEAATGVLQSSRQTCRGKPEDNLWNSSKKVKHCGRWPQQACTTMFFVIPKNVTSERPIALVPIRICWWEGLRAPE